MRSPDLDLAQPVLQPMLVDRSPGQYLGALHDCGSGGNCLFLSMAWMIEDGGGKRLKKLLCGRCCRNMTLPTTYWGELH